MLESGPRSHDRTDFVDITGQVQQRLADLEPADGHAHARGDSAARIKTGRYGWSVSVPVENGCLRPGTWQKIRFCDFDEPRTRRVRLRKI